jgi:hypothetical protein
MSTPAWPPTTEADLDLAMRNGILIENQKLDLKRELKGGESGNKEIAKDIAAFSVYGGLIIIGVEEGEVGKTPPSLTPIDLAGQSERIESVGHTRVDEQVSVTTTKILSSTAPGKGYLLVEVPVSPRPPHMADNKYYSRGDTKNIVLSNAEVMSWHERTLGQRVDAIEQVRSALQHFAATSEPWVELLIYATPLGAREDILLRLSESHSWQSDARSLVHLAASGCHPPVSTLRDPTQYDRHHEGILVATDLTPSGQRGGYRRVELIFEDSGKLTLRSGGLKEHIPGTSPALHGINEPLVLGHIEFLVHIAEQVSKYGFNGSWRFAIAARALGNAVSLTLGHDFGRSSGAPVYRSATYENTTTVSLNEIMNSPQSVVRSLASKLLRALGTGGEWEWLMA